MANSENMPTTGHDNVAGLLTLNNLSYSLPNDLSVSISRTGTTQFFQTKGGAPGQNLICILNTGSAYIDPKRSYLRLDLTNTGTSAMSFGGGTACNLFDRSVISTRDGSVLERIDNLNVLSRVRQYYEHGIEYNHSVLSAAGGRFGGTTEANTDPAFLQPGDSARFIIPMSMVSPLFDSKQLFPNSLASGLRIDLQLASANRAFQKSTTDVSTTPLNYQITDCAIVCESYQLSDLVLRTLNQISSSSGLEYVYNTWFNTSGKRASSSINIESRKAVSRALSCFYVETAMDSATEYKVDSFKAIPPAAVDIQARVGSLYLPTQSSLRAPTSTMLAPELYSHALMAFEKYRDAKGSSAVSMREFNDGSSIFASSLERDTIGGAGIPLSNSRILSVDGTFNAPLPGEIFAIGLFLKYTSLCRIYLSNIVLET